MKSSNSLIGTTAMTSASALRVVIQIAILPIIGRLLGPHAYGQIALVSPFIFFSVLLAESGLGACIVRADKATRELEGTIFCFSAAFSLFFIVLFAALAYPIGALMHEPMFPPLLLGMSSILMLAAFNIVPAALLLREKRYDWIATSDLASTFGGVAAIVTGIMLGWGVWSLVAQQISFWVCKVIVVTIGSHWRPSFLFRWTLIKENIYFGSNLTASSVLGFISRNIDNVLIGTFMGSEILGYYALAFQIVGLPSMVLSGSVYYTLFAGTSEAKRSGNTSAAQFLRILRGTLLISAPMMVGLAVTAPLSIPLLLGAKWIPTATLIILLAPLGLCGSISAATSAVLVGLGRADIAFRISLIFSTATILAIIAGVFISSSAVALGVSLTAIAGCYFTLRIIVRECGGGFREIGKAMAAPLTASLLMGGIVLALQQVMPAGLPLGISLCLSIVAGMFAYGVILFGLFHDQLSADIATIKTAILSQIRR